MKSFSLLLFLSFSATAATPLELKSFLDKARQNDPKIQSIVADRLKAKYLVDLGLPSRQLLLSVKSEYGFSSEGRTTMLSAVVSKPILESGTLLSIGQTRTDRPDREEEVLELRIEQALYRNAFGGQTRDLVKALELEQGVSELQVIEAYEDYVQQLIHDYLDLTFSYLNFQSARRQRESSESLLKNVQARRKNNIASTTDERRAKLLLSQRKEVELQALMELEAQGRRIKRIIGDEGNTPIVPQTYLDLGHGLANLDNSLESFLNTSRSRLIYERMETIAEARLAVEKENLRPEANLLLGFNVDDSRRFNTKVKREEGVVGLRIDIPFGNSNVEAQIKQANYQLLKSKLEKKNFSDGMKESLEVIKNQIRRQQDRVMISKEKQELSAQIVKDEEKRYRVGRITLEKLIEDRNVEAQSQFDYLYELTTLNKLIVNWMALTDSLIDKID